MLRELEYELEGEYELEAELEGEFEGEFEAEREVIGVDTRVRVTNTRAAPFRYICNLVDNNGLTPMCTGTLIAPNVVLTAAHCLFNRTPARMTVVPGRNGIQRPFGTANAQKFGFAQNFKDANDFVTPNDYAVIYLSQPIGNTVGHWSIAHTSSPTDPLGTSISGAPLPTGQQRVNISGYPADKCFVTGNPPQRVCQQWRARNRLRVVQGGMMHYLNDTFGGHSGSPVWIKRPASLGGRVMVGLHVGGDDLGRAGGTPFAANRGIRFTPAIVNDIRRLVGLAPTVPRRPPRTQPPARPFVRVLDGFQFDRPGVQPHHQPIIAELARRIVAAGPPRIHTIRIVGHADSAGGDAYNLNLGRQRALDVQRHLVAAIERLRPGHSRNVQVVVQSLGESRPIAPNTTPQGRARNRRVEVTLVGR
jgi:V8-like Glu-specific endopeptidase/outer membrane protein OmpA-like peptidoglycan-associated protein